jgi:hypothetical protein
MMIARPGEFPLPAGTPLARIFHTPRGRKAADLIHTPLQRGVNQGRLVSWSHMCEISGLGSGPKGRLVRRVVNLQNPRPDTEQTVNLRPPLPLALETIKGTIKQMLFPDQPVTLSPEQVRELNQKLSEMCHDINNQLSLVMAAVELIRHKSDSAARMVGTLGDQPSRINQNLS